MISAIIPTYNRPTQLIKSIENLKACIPAPDEILVHIDAGDSMTEPVLNMAFPDVRVISSVTRMGPGGGRNLLVAAAANKFVASFDDDSYPIDPDFFSRLKFLLKNFPDAAIVNAAIFHQGEVVSKDTKTVAWTSDFFGGACCYRREYFLKTAGYVPLPQAYGMEEVDLGLRIHSTGGKILYSPWLRIFHDTNLEHHTDPKITSASITNQILLTFLRYPIRLWGIGLAQCLNRIVWLIRHRRFHGILSGIISIPSALWRNRRYRSTLSKSQIRSFLMLRKSPTSVPFPSAEN